jgi:hypothetical protein
MIKADQRAIVRSLPNRLLLPKFRYPSARSGALVSVSHVSPRRVEEPQGFSQSFA